MLTKYQVGDRLVLDDYNGPGKYIRILSYRESPGFPAFRLKEPNAPDMFWFPVNEFDIMPWRYATPAEILLFFEKN